MGGTPSCIAEECPYQLCALVLNGRGKSYTTATEGGLHMCVRCGRPLELKSVDSWNEWLQSGSYATAFH